LIATSPGQVYAVLRDVETGIDRFLNVNPNFARQLFDALYAVENPQPTPVPTKPPDWRLDVVDQPALEYQVVWPASDQ
jgi:hypothetical protein